MDSMAALDALVRAATSKQSPRKGSLIKYATVTVDGLLLDGPVPTLIPGKITAFCSYKTGDRVALIFDGSTPIILAVVGGGDPNVVVVGGVAYEASGVVEVSSAAPFTAYAPIYSRVLSVPAPYQPPPGWDFQVTTYTSGNRICLFNLDAPTVGGVMTVRHLQVANSAVGTGASFLWRLCRV